MSNIYGKHIINVLKHIFVDTDFTNVNSSGYVKVNCPFHNDEKASASLNPIDGYFNCFSHCTPDEGLQFKQFLIKYLKEVKHLSGTDNEIEKTFKDILIHYDNNTFNVLTNDSILNHPNEVFNLRLLGFNNNDLIQQLKLTYKQDWLFAIPVEIGNVIMGYKYYTNKPNEKTNNSKSGCTKGLKNGLIIPFNLFVSDNQPVLICEGEKDMLIARQLGYNAICFTGGCKAIPELFGKYFINRNVYIAYDNDTAGKEGAIKLANYLLKYTKQIKVLTQFHQHLQNKEDVYDFFVKYKLTKELFDNYIDTTPFHTFTQLDTPKQKIVPLSSCEKPENYNKLLTSYIQIRAEGQTPQSIPQKIYCVFKNDAQQEATVEFDFLENPKHFIVDFLLQTPTQIKAFVKSQIVPVLVKQNSELKNKELANFWLSKEHMTIYTSIPAQYTESEISRDEDNGSETTQITMYATEKLHTSHVYLVSYKAYALLNKKHQLCLIAENIKPATQSFKNYEITTKTDEMIQCFSAQNVALKLLDLYNRMKNKIPFLDYDLWLAYELTFHSCFSFKFNNNSCRGTIYTNVIGDTRVGKSQLGQELVKLYHQGKFINAKLATVDALVGGTDKQGDNTYVKAGVLPRNHESLLVLEELHGLGNDYFKKITEIKSSSKVTISRVSGELSLPCRVRLIEISNPKLDNNKSADSVRLFSNGVQVIKNLINNPEDIARNDIYMIIAKPKQYNYGTLEHKNNHFLPMYSKELYEDKIKWVWSRKEAQIFYEDESYFVTKGKELQHIFDCDGLGIMGAEAPEKLARLSIALAGMLVSTDDSKEIIYVKKEHIDYITSWIIKIYSSDIMRIDEYVKTNREYNVYYPDTDLVKMHDLYIEFEDAIEFLARGDIPNKNTLMSYLGEDVKKITKLISSLARAKFIKQEQDKIIPSTKFRECWKDYSKNKKTEIVDRKLII